MKQIQENVEDKCDTYTDDDRHADRKQVSEYPADHIEML
jgi:hypothetical protein